MTKKIQKTHIKPKHRRIMYVVYHKLPANIKRPLKTVIQSTKIIGLLAAGLGFLGFTVMDFMLKITTSYLQPLQITFFLNFFTVFWCLIGVGIFGSKIIKTNNYPLHIARGVMSVIGGVCIVSSFSLLKVSTAYSLIFLAPIISVILSLIFLKSPPTRGQILGTIIGFFGILVIFRPGQTNLNLGHLYAIIGASTIAINGVLIKKFAKSEHPSSYVFYSGIITIITLIYFSGQNLTSIPIWIYVILAASGLLFTFNIMLIVLAIQNIHLQVLGSIHYTQIIWMFLFEWAFLSIAPDIWVITGSIFIFLGGLIVSSPIIIKQQIIKLLSSFKRPYK
ncbi:MAG: DMT family transporter [SAR324 cluster bacterium]|nr:DMT family transporter [SAR324 cluster bacterium]